MLILQKYRIDLLYQSKHEVETLLAKFGYFPVWQYDGSGNPYTYLICPINTEIATNDTLIPGSDPTYKLYLAHMFGLGGASSILITFTYIETIDLHLNGPSKFTRTVNGNNVTVVQTTSVPEGEGTRTYVCTVVFNTSTGTHTITNTSTYQDSHTTSTTTSTTDPTTGETTTTTETIDSQTGDETTSTTTYDENGTMTGSSTHTDYGSGGSYDSLQTYYDDGTISQDHDQTTNTDGSSVAHTTNYDENGDPTDGNTQWVDTSQNQNTQSYEYDENGDPYVSGYDINTENNPNGGETLNNPIDTGVLAFDGRDFDIHLKAKFYWNNLQYNNVGGGKFKAKVNPILNLSAEDANHKVNGFLVLFLTGNTETSNYYTFTGSPVTGNSTYPTLTRVNKYLNDSASTVYNVNWHQQLSNVNACLGLANGATGNGTFIFDIQARSNVFTIVMKNASGSIIGKTVTKSNPNGQANLNFGNASFADVTVELGHWDSVVDGTEYSFVYEVIEFNVTKLPENP